MPESEWKEIAEQWKGIAQMRVEASMIYRAEAEKGLRVAKAAVKFREEMRSHSTGAAVLGEASMKELDAELLMSLKAMGMM